MKTLTGLLAFSFLIPLLGCGQEKPEGALTSYEYRESRMKVSPSEYYRVDRQEGIVRLAYSFEGDNEITVIRIDEDILAQIQDIVSGHRLWRLKDSYTPVARILDGYMWHVDIRYEGSSITSGGSNARPSGRLREGIESINALLRSLADNHSPDDLLGTEKHYDR